MSPSFTSDKRERISNLLISSGASLFGRFGMKKTTIEQIAAASGIAKGSFYAFYPSKEHLYIAVLKFTRSRIASEIILPILTSSKTPDESLSRLIKQGLTFADAFPELADYFDPVIGKELVQIAGEMNFDPEELVPVPDFNMIEDYWHDRGFEISIAPDRLAHAVETIIFLAFTEGGPGKPGKPGKTLSHYTDGASLLIELSGIGLAGYVCCKQ